MSKELDVTVGEYNFYCSGNGDYGMFSVFISKNGKLLMHQSWSRMPTKEEATSFLELLDGGSRK